MHVSANMHISERGHAHEVYHAHEREHTHECERAVHVHTGREPRQSKERLATLSVLESLRD